MTKKEAIEELLSTVKACDKDIAEFSTKLASFPCEALEGSSYAFEIAARRQVYKRVAEALQAGKSSVAFIKDYVTNEAIKGAKHPSRSTSPCVNLMAQMKAAAWANVIEIVELITE